MSSSALSQVTTKLPSAVKLQSTPVKQASKPVVTDSPGNWKHPKLAEITRRQRKTEFSERNIKTIAFNGGAFLISVVLRQLAVSKLPTGFVSADIKAYVAWTYLALQLIPVVNIVIALLPLVRRQDDLADIALTPGQRKLLGLPPSSVPPTPNSAISTPPRYSRTPSLAGSATSNKSYTSSPLSGNGSPASDRRLSGSPYSPSTGSPLFQKAVTGGFGGRKSSFGSPSQLGVSTATSLFSGDGPGTPSPLAGKGSSVGLNNKWLYERGRKRPSGNSFLN
ncbi:NPCC-domain-containing protein [Coniochaeta ligniaria NRRL 30616]|uniref:NPCC-domain-containing protein n=1 Tax=Coniochaeta ligniaria NRRL 30616 TaxID=1408157 RepID=A0A1J7JAH2_9PEZI|nr:NPCC-domain-containing protein [Coniochaeta ligniaria NRRL 30616]